MRNKKFALLIVLLWTVSASAATKEWLHVHVDDKKTDGGNVKINIPLTLVETILPLIEEKNLQNGRINIRDHDISTEELRKVWTAVKAEGDMEFVTVEKRGENVRVYTQGNFLMVQSDKDSNQKVNNQKVNIQIPLTVVDAMLSGSGEGLNLVAGVKALKQSGVRDIIRVQDDLSTVRVWIDENSKVK